MSLKNQYLFKGWVWDADGSHGKKADIIIIEWE
jgi:hypothetical protein